MKWNDSGASKTNTTVEPSYTRFRISYFKNDSDMISSYLELRHFFFATCGLELAVIVMSKALACQYILCNSVGTESRLFVKTMKKRLFLSLLWGSSHQHVPLQNLG